MVEFLEAKDLAFLALLVVALLFEGRRQLMVGIAMGVEGTLNSLKEDGFIDIDEKGEVLPKKS